MLPRTTFEQRVRFYSDADALLYPGFLTHPVVVANVRLNLRSLGPGDLFMLKVRAEGATDNEWQIWMVATSIWMVGGRSVLGNDDAIPFLAEYLRALPITALRTLFSLTLGLFVRSQRAVAAVQVYCYENTSRYKWATHGLGQSSGVPGAEKLGHNVVQQVWHAYNTLEDRRLREEQQWEASKLVASSNSPKAVKKLDDKDRLKRREEQDRREKELDHYYYKQLGVIDDQNRSVQATDGSMVGLQGLKTADDLVEEMRRWVTGDHDFHDQIVADYKRAKTQEWQRQQEDREALRLALLQKREEMGLDETRPQPILALTAEQLHHQLQGRQTGYRGRVSFIPEASHASRLAEVYLDESAVTPGNLIVENGKVRDPAADPDMDRRTLDMLVKGRNPAFRSGDK